MSQEGTLNKAESTSKTVTRPLTRENGQPHIVRASRYIDDLCQSELSMDYGKRFSSYRNMMADDAVANSVDYTNVHVLTALSKGMAVPSSKSSVSVESANFINYNLHNFSYGTWREAMADACTDLINGFIPLNIVTERASVGPYKGMQKLRKLSPRHPESVYGWVWNKNNTELLGFVQNANIVQTKEPDTRKKTFRGHIDYGDIFSGYYQRNYEYPFIHRQEMLLFRHNPTFNNPQGNSPLNHCFKAWMEKELIENLEVVAVSKDFGGVIVLRLPSEFLEKANDPDINPEIYREYLELQRDAENLQKGKSTHLILSSDKDEVTSQYLYDMEIQGIQGAGKQYNTEDLTNQRRRAIYNVFGTGFLLLGQNGHGSNALAGSQMTTFDHYVQRAIDWKVDVINHQLIPRLLAANNIFLEHKDMPVFKAADPTRPDLDTLSKVLQRSTSTNSLTLEGFRKTYELMGISTEGLEEFFEERKEMANKSRAGESQGTSGTGNSQDGGANTATNNENKSLNKNLGFDYQTEDELVLVDTVTGDPIFIKKKG